MAVTNYFLVFQSARNNFYDNKVKLPCGAIVTHQDFIDLHQKCSTESGISAGYHLTGEHMFLTGGNHTEMCTQRCTDFSNAYTYAYTFLAKEAEGSLE